MSAEILTTIAAQQSADLQRVAVSLGSDVIPYLKRIESGVDEILKPYYDLSITTARQAKILAEIDALTNAELSAYLKDFNKSISAIGTASVASGVKALDVAIVSDVNINTPKKSEVDAAIISTPIQQGDKSWTTYKGIQSAFKDQYTTEVSSAMMASMQGAQNGKEVADAAYTQLHYTGKKASKSVLDRARRSANSLSATASNHAANVARVQFGEANKKLIKGYVFIAVIDSVTSTTCRSGDGTTMSADDPRFAAWAPPRHRGCRSALSYDVNDRYKLDDESSKRASSFRVDGLQDPKPISSKQNYYEAMSKLNAADQDEILGPTLGKAFRKGLDDGTLTPESFAKMTVDSLFQPLSIAQMEQRSNRLGELLRAESGVTKKKPSPTVKKPKAPTKVEESISSIKKANARVPSGNTELKGDKIISKNGSPVIKRPLTNEERAYVDYYKGDGFFDANKILRNQSKYSEQEVSSAKAMMRSINDAISKSELDGDMVVYRGLRGGEAFNGIDNSAIGKLINLDTVQSTSTDARVALNYSGAMKVGDDYYSSSGGSTIFKIRLKKGQNALDVDGLTGINTSEKEMLISSSGKYRVNSVETRTDNTGKVVLKIVNVDYED